MSFSSFPDLEEGNFNNISVGNASLFQVMGRWRRGEERRREGRRGGKI
jgi:hypothetical protein